MQFGDLEEAVVVGDGADDADCLVLVGLFRGFGGDFGGDAGDGHGRAVDAGHEEALEDDFVEVGFGTAWRAVLVMFIYVDCVLAAGVCFPRGLLETGTRVGLTS